ncbi:hypothetical protein KJZ99_04070 [bacterium]|nr:hypothetical protein [bacterium]
MTLQYSSTTVTLTGRTGARKPLDVQPERLQSVGEYEDGTIEVYDRDVVVWLATFEIRGMSQSKLAELRNFFLHTVKGSKHQFTLTPDSGVDLGAGNGVAVTCQLFGNLPPHRLYAAPSIYSQKFTVRYRSLGTSTPS